MSTFTTDLTNRTTALVDEGLFKAERVISSPQDARIRLADGSEVINMCANNYLGLANHPALVEAAHKALDTYGYGMASVRFICGTQTVHRELEERISAFLGTEDTILYSSCFDANTGLFETILDEHDAVVSDSLNHASLIDGIRLCKARRLRFANGDVSDLEAKLGEGGHHSRVGAGISLQDPAGIGESAGREGLLGFGTGLARHSHGSASGAHVIPSSRQSP